MNEGLGTGTAQAGATQAGAMQMGATRAAARRKAKSASAFRTISEVAGELDVPQHVLRFWETKFAQVKPLKRGGGRRYYRPEDVALLRRIKALLYTDGYTIRGVQKLLREGGVKALRGDDHDAAASETSTMATGNDAPPASVAADPPGAAETLLPEETRSALAAALDELEAARTLLRRRS